MANEKSSEWITLTYSPDPARDESGRVSFPNVLKPAAYDDGKEKYEVTLLFPKNSPAIPKLMALAKAAKAKAFPNVQVDNPIKDGDLKYVENSEKYWMYQGMWSVRFSSNYQPVVVDQRKQEILREENFYPGCWAVLHCNAYGWTYKNMKRGISFGFDAAQLVRHDERFGGGRPDADAIFSDVPVEMDPSAGMGGDGFTQPAGQQPAAGPAPSDVDEWMSGPAPQPQAASGGNANNWL